MVETKKSRKKLVALWVGGGVIALLVFFWAVGSQMPDTAEADVASSPAEGIVTKAAPEKKEAQAESTEKEPQAKEEPVKKEPVEEVKAEAPKPAKSALAKDVQAGIEANFPGGLSASSPLFVITKYEDVSAGTVRVYAQENLTDNGRDEIARQVFNMSGTTKEKLSTVVVRDASGKDSNHYR